jgi:hypothetical protein
VGIILTGPTFSNRAGHKHHGATGRPVIMPRSKLLAAEVIYNLCDHTRQPPR